MIDPSDKMRSSCRAKPKKWGNPSMSWGGTRKDKPFWKSKTLWAALGCLALTAIPPTSAIIVANPEAWGVITSAVFGGLRLITDKKVKVK